MDSEEFADIPVGDERSHPEWYARDVLEKIVDCRVPQEIGCHTLTHMFVSGSEESRQRFDWEAGCCVEPFRELGLPRPRSSIYPKHYMAHFDLLTKHGFECFRGPEMGWWERMPTAATSGAARLFSQKMRDCPVVSLPAVCQDGLTMIPSSQYYPGFHSVGKYVSIEDRVQRAIKGLKLAAKKKRIFHLWTHPFNLGVWTDELLSEMNVVAGHIRTTDLAGEIKSMEMSAALNKE